jgi:hypothetical protein
MRSRFIPLNIRTAALAVICATTISLLMTAVPASAATAYRLVVDSSQKCLDLPSGNTADNVVLQQFTCHGGNNQRWLVMPRTDGYYTIVSVVSNKCADVHAGSTANGAVVQQFTCHGGPNQQWAINFSTRSFVARHSGKCLDIRGGGTGDGAIAQQFTCHGGANQRWTMFST